MMVTALVFLAIIITAFIALLWWRQERIVFQPPGVSPEGPADVRRLEYASHDGLALFAYVVEPHEAPARGVVIAFHGNADLAVWRIPWAIEVVRRTGWAVAIPEYRGYAGVGGVPSVDGTRRDTRAALQAIRSALPVADSALIYHGHSLGTAIATELAQHHAPARLILESPFTSARAMARIVVARPVELVWGMISRVHYDTESTVRAIEVPVWVAHGERDLIVPSEMGEAVHAAARRSGDLLLVPGAGHNDLADEGGARYWRWLTTAIEHEGGAPSSNAGPIDQEPN